MWLDRIEVTELIGKTLKDCYQSGDEIYFVDSNDDQYKLYHDQDCCESVGVESIVGDLKDLVGNPILVAEEATSEKDPPDYKRDYPPESCTWTFYKFATIKGHVDIRFVGESNGYYSESVSFSKCFDATKETKETLW